MLVTSWLLRCIWYYSSNSTFSEKQSESKIWNFEKKLLSCFIWSLFYYEMQIYRYFKLFLCVEKRNKVEWHIQKIKVWDGCGLLYFLLPQKIIESGGITGTIVSDFSLHLCLLQNKESFYEEISWKWKWRFANCNCTS